MNGNISWSELLEPHIGRFVAADVSGGRAVYNAVGSRAMAELLREIAKRLDYAVAALSGPVPQDVAELVLAARRVAFEDRSDSAMRRLDVASEAFADRVPWNGEPEDNAILDLGRASLKQGESNK